MNQSTSIFAALTLGFIVFVVVRGELGKYLTILGI